MTDEQIIRRAVELAPAEWSIQDSVVVGPWPLELVRLDDFFSSPVFSYALAAQLVEQVDSTDYVLSAHPKATEIREWFDHALWDHTEESGPDRTLNTLRAIVESGVLNES